MMLMASPVVMVRTFKLLSLRAGLLLSSLDVFLLSDEVAVCSSVFPNPHAPNEEDRP